jgi:GcrA cell cycle regulator
MLWSFSRGTHDMEWSDETIGRLKLLWTEGLSTAEIGRRMGISKNAVVGKAHRLLLESRPSPIRRDSASGRPPRAASPRRVVGPTLPSMAAEARAEPAMPAAPTAHLAPAPAAEPVPALRPVPLLPRADGAAAGSPVAGRAASPARAASASAMPTRCTASRTARPMPRSPMSRCATGGKTRPEQHPRKIW